MSVQRYTSHTCPLIDLIILAWKQKHLCQLVIVSDNLWYPRCYIHLWCRYLWLCLSMFVCFCFCLLQVFVCLLSAPFNLQFDLPSSAGSNHPSIWACWEPTELCDDGETQCEHGLITPSIFHVDAQLAGNCRNSIVSVEPGRRSILVLIWEALSMTCMLPFEC